MGISWLARAPLAYQEKLCCMESIGGLITSLFLVTAQLELVIAYSKFRYNIWVESSRTKNYRKQCNSLLLRGGTLKSRIDGGSCCRWDSISHDRGYEKVCKKKRNRIFMDNVKQYKVFYIKSFLGTFAPWWWLLIQEPKHVAVKLYNI